MSRLQRAWGLRPAPGLHPRTFAHTHTSLTRISMVKAQKQKRPAQRAVGRKRGNGGGGPKNPKNRNIVAISQGVGRVPNRNFAPSSAASARAGLSALHPRHLALPRSVAPYTVIKTTTRIGSSRNVNLIGAFRDYLDGNEMETWADIVMMSGLASGSAVSAASNTIAHRMPGYSGLEGATLVPSAVTLQLMNPSSLQLTSGVVYVGRSVTQLDWAGESASWSAKAEEFVSFSRPELVSAADLAIRPVIVDAVPFNMNNLADFRPLEHENDATDYQYTWGSSAKLHPRGFGPIVVYNPDGLQLQYLITVEWRVRFGFGNVAVSSHTHHTPATDATWSSVLRQMHSEGSGVKRGKAATSS